MSGVSRRNPFAPQAAAPAKAPSRNPFDAAPAASAGHSAPAATVDVNDPFGLARRSGGAASAQSVPASAASASATAATPSPVVPAAAPPAAAPVSAHALHPVASAPVLHTAAGTTTSSEPARPKFVSAAQLRQQMPQTAAAAVAPVPQPAAAQSSASSATSSTAFSPPVATAAAVARPAAEPALPPPTAAKSLARQRADDIFDDDIPAPSDGLAAEIKLSDAHAAEHDGNFFDDVDNYMYPNTPVTPEVSMLAASKAGTATVPAATTTAGLAPAVGTTIPSASALPPAAPTIPATKAPEPLSPPVTSPEPAVLASAIRSRTRIKHEWEEITDPSRLHQLLTDMAEERDYLRRRLQEQQLALAARMTSPREAVAALLCGQPTSLEHFQSLEQKMALLDTAVALNSGAALTKVMQYLTKTLSERVLQQQLSSRPVAAQHLFKYWSQSGEYEKIHRTAAATGMHTIADTAALRIMFRDRAPSLRQAAIVEAIKDFEWRQRPTEELREYKDLLHMQIIMEEHDAKAEQLGTNAQMVALPRKATVPLSSAVVTVYYCCLYHYHDSEDKVGSLAAVQKVLQLSEKQYFATIIGALALRKNWDEIEKLCTVKSVFSSGKLQPRIASKLLVSLLMSAHAPPEVMAKYLKLITDSEEKLKLANACNCYSAAIDALIEIRDRERLRAYANRADVSRDPALIARIRSAEQNSSIKWH